mgnify:CR=1 FL=1
MVRSPRMREYVRRRFMGMTIDESAEGLYASGASGCNSYFLHGGKDLLRELEERADESVLESMRRIREGSLRSLEVMEAIRDGKIGVEEGAGYRMEAAKFLLGSAGLGVVKRSESRGVVGVVDADFLRELKGMGEREVRSDGEGQVSDVC